MRKPKSLVLTGWLAAAALILLAGCREGDSESCPPTAAPATPTAAAQSYVWPGAEWEVSSPETEGMDADRLEDVAAYCEAHNCRGVVIVRHGRIAWERYWGGWDEDSTDNSWSMAKSITSALIGIAIAQGKIEGLDQSAADYIQEWRGTDKEKITLRHLLSMTSGLSWSMTYDPPSGDTINLLNSDDAVGYAVGRPLYRKPGSDWYYSDGDVQLLARIIKVATGMEAGQYAQQELFGPIGVEGATWRTDKLGQTWTWCCVLSSARDFARFGYLYLRDGRWGDRQIVPEEWVLESIQPSQWENLHYGYYWWLLDLPDVPEDIFAAIGFQTKRIYVIPSLDIVAVRLGKGDDEWQDNDFLKPIVESAAGS